MRKILLVLMLVGLTNPLMAQDPIELSEVLIKGANYRYLDAVNYEEAPMPVRFLERQAATFKGEGRDLYVDDFGSYAVEFYIPDGKVVAFYNEDNEVIKTIERYQDVQLPLEVRYAIKTEYPGWTIVKDVYHVRYNANTDVDSRMYYTIKLTNGDKTMRVKIADDGTYL